MECLNLHDMDFISSSNAPKSSVSGMSGKYGLNIVLLAQLSELLHDDVINVESEEAPGFKLK